MTRDTRTSNHDADVTPEAPAGPFSIGSDVWPGAGKAIEEMGELQQVLGKLIGSGGDTDHFDGTDLHQRLIDEIGDVVGSLRWFVAVNDLPSGAVERRATTKFEWFDRWHREHGGSPGDRSGQ